MKRIIIPILSLLILSGCDFLSISQKSSKIRITESKVIPINNVEQFDQLVLVGKPAVVKFETKWCSACQIMKPIFDNLSNKYFNKINFVSVQADKISELPERYDMQGVPTFLFFKSGQKVNEMIGEIDLHTFDDAIQKLL